MGLPSGPYPEWVIPCQISEIYGQIVRPNFKSAIIKNHS